MKTIDNTIKKAGIGSLFVAGALALGTLVSPQVENYKTLTNELSSMSIGERQYTVSQEMADFKEENFYGKIQKIGKRLALDKYQPRRKNFQ